VLTVAGDASAAEVFALAEKYFGVLDRFRRSRRRRAATCGARPPPGPETVVGNVPAPRLYLSHRTHPFGTAGTTRSRCSPRSWATAAAAGSTSGSPTASGSPSRTTIGSYGVDLAHAPAPLIITATAKDGVDVETLEAGLVEVVGSLVTEPVTDEELSRAKALLTTAWWRQLSTVGGRADTLGRYATQFGDPGTAAYRLPQWLAVTADDVTEAAALTLKPESRVTLTYLPQEESA